MDSAPERFVVWLLQNCECEKFIFKFSDALQIHVSSILYASLGFMMIPINIPLILPTNFDLRVKFFKDHVHKSEKILLCNALKIFKCLSQNHTQPLTAKTIRRLKRLSKNLLPHSPRLAHLVQQFIRKDDCPFKRLPLDVRKMICSHLSVHEIQNIACFIGNYTRRVIEWNNTHKGYIWNQDLEEKSIYRLAHEVNCLILDGDKFYRCDRLLYAATNLHSLNLRCPKPADLVCLNRCVTLTSLKSLTIEASQFNEIAKSKALTNLTALNLKSRGKIDLQIDLSNFHFLMKLKIKGVTLPISCFEHLFKNETLRNLEELHFRESFLWPESIDLLLRTTTLGNLRTLTIWHGSSVYAEQLMNFLESPTLSSLTHLAIEGQLHFLHFERRTPPQKILRDLRKLSLSLSFMNPSFDTHFCHHVAPHLSQLQELNFSYHHHDLPFMWFPQLTKVNLKCCDIDDNKLKHLSTASVWNRLVELNLSLNPITTKGTVYFNSSTLQNLTYLNLEYCRIEDIGVEAIITAPAMQALITLKVGGNPITPLVAQYANFFPGLYTLGL